MNRAASGTDAPSLTGADLGAAIRLDVLDQSMRARIGHIGSSLSIADILAALFSPGGALRNARPDDPDRDRFVLAKGHAVLALYSALRHAGVLTEEQLDTFATDGTELVGHPDHRLPGVDFSTGSLGQGLSLAAGAALAARLQGSQRRVFALLSDAECNEGAVWEAAQFAGHHRLGRLTAIVDVNGQQALGYTRDILDATALPDRWAAFGWDVAVVDGHDVAALQGAIGDPPDAGVAPRVVLAQTTFGQGVSFMERKIEWHYLPMTDEQHRQARSEIEESAA